MTIPSGSGVPAPMLKGKHKAIVVCWFLGLGSLVSWNSILTIEDYYYDLFPVDFSILLKLEKLICSLRNALKGFDFKIDGLIDHPSEYLVVEVLCLTTIFTFCLKKYHPSRVLTLVYQPFALGTMALLTYNEAKINTRKRNIAGYMLFTASTLMLIVVDLVTSGKGGVGPYIGICAVVAALGVADAHVQGGMVGDLSFMCPEFVQSFFAGLAASGALTSALRLLTKAVFEKSKNGLRKGVMLFLAISTFLEFLSVLLYAFLFPRLPIVKYYRAKAASEGSKTVSADLAAAGILKPENQEEVLHFPFNDFTWALLHAADDDKPPERLSNKELFLQNTDYALDLFLIYVLTLSIFPGFLYEDTGKHQLGSWYSLVLVAVFNVWDLISRYIPLVECLKLESRNGLMIASLSRFLLVPAFFFTAKHGDQGWMIMLTSFLGLTNGYLSVCVLTEAPKGYKGPEQNALGNLLVLCLFAGIFSGVVLDWLWLIGK
ncbi:hypothetical protein POTOM_014996 [Populus tomentosa]|uniref:Uncharacterized protein n=1 Tax=Populus tomentosa TaxID=118781 RepID=A0A8X7ZWY7_POPTO|nr:hypothetical protein POTOM_014996 [Populus tomentosa]